MINYNKNFVLNGMYAFILIILYNIYNSNYINRIINQIYILNYTSVFILINIIGLYLLLQHLSFEIKIICTLKYNLLLDINIFYFNYY